MLLNIVNAKACPDKEFDFSCKIEVNQNLLEEKGFEFLTPLSLVGKMCYKNEKLLLEGFVKFRLKAICDNCSEEFEKDFSLNYSEVFYESFNTHNEEDYLINQTCVEIDKPVIDFVLMNLPTRILCKSSCKGLCPICGKNRNYGDCFCKNIAQNEKDFDNPFNSLKS